MSKTPEDFRKALELSGLASGFITDAQARDAMILLGLTVEDPKPEPGLYLHEDGRFVRVYGRGEQQDDAVSAYADTEWVAENRDKLTPARVVPAEPVELTEEQVGELWDATDPGEFYLWDELSNSTRGRYTTVTNAALAKHGHGAPSRELPNLDEVYHAIGEAQSLKVNDSDVRAATDAVMALLKGTP